MARRDQASFTTLDTADNARALELLAAGGWATHAHGGKVRLASLDPAEIGAVNRSLVLAGVAVHEIATGGSRLETLFMDLVFLDVHLGGWSGMELLETHAVAAEVILTTAHSEYALRSYDLKVADYLLKPFTFPRFVQAVGRARGNLARREEPGARDIVFVKTELRLEKVRLDEVLYIEGVRDYRRVHTVHKRIMTLQTFGELEARIATDVVCRVHKSYMVALDRIETVERDRIKIGDALIPVSKTYRDRFYALIGHRT